MFFHVNEMVHRMRAQWHCHGGPGNRKVDATGLINLDDGARAAESSAPFSALPLSPRATPNAKSLRHTTRGDLMSGI